MVSVMGTAFNTLRDWRDRGYSLRRPPLILPAYDPAGGGRDRDALVIVAREEHQRGEPHDPDFAILTAFRVLLAQNMPPSLEFPDKVAQLLRLHLTLKGWKNRGLAFGHVFCVEGNGVGYGMASTLRQRISGNVVTYTTVGGKDDKAAGNSGIVMPRLAGLDLLRVLVETHVLKVQRDAPGAKDLERQMNSFVWRGVGRPEAMEGQHDDLVMALAGSAWIGSKVIPPTIKAKSYSSKGRVN